MTKLNTYSEDLKTHIDELEEQILQTVCLYMLYSNWLGSRPVGSRPFCRIRRGGGEADDQ